MINHRGGDNMAEKEWGEEEEEDDDEDW